MHKFIAIAVSVLSVLGPASASLDACGDKFMLIGRGIRYQRAYASAHPAAIVIYESARKRQARGETAQLQQLLAGAGHKVQLVSDRAALERVTSALPDLILADDTDVAELTQTLPRIAPLLFSTTILQSKGRHPLSVIDDALKDKAKHAVSRS